MTGKLQGAKDNGWAREEVVVALKKAVGVDKLPKKAEEKVNKIFGESIGANNPRLQRRKGLFK